MLAMGVYFRSGEGIKNPVDVCGVPIQVGDTITYDWFECKDPVQHMRDLFPDMAKWSDEKINKRIHKPCFRVLKNDKGVFYGEGLEEDERHNRMYLHDFRFKHTKVVPIKD